MTSNTKIATKELTAIVEHFQISGKLEGISAHKSGHINQTYLSTWKDGVQSRKYIHQKINNLVFKDIPGVMSNIQKVLLHLRSKKVGDKTLEVIPSKEGEAFVLDAKGNAWRTYSYIEDTITYDICPSSKHAEEAASILGRFQAALIDIDPSDFKETIPNFLSSPFRYLQLDQALKSASDERRRASLEEVSFALARRDFANTIEKCQKNGAIPTRVVHGDMKLNNVLFDKEKPDATCIVDLDTCMPGYSLFDFGDLARSAAVPAAEDEQDFSKIFIDLSLFQSLVSGYLGFMGSHLTAAEISALSSVPRLLALTLGVRFLTDFLNDDVYFPVVDKEHNLRRARTQFQLVKSMESARDEMQRIVGDTCKELL